MSRSRAPRVVEWCRCAKRRRSRRWFRSRCASLRAREHSADRARIRERGGERAAVPARWRCASRPPGFRAHDVRGRARLPGRHGRPAGRLAAGGRQHTAVGRELLRSFGRAAAARGCRPQRHRGRRGRAALQPSSWLHHRSSSCGRPRLRRERIVCDFHLAPGSDTGVSARARRQPEPELSVGLESQHLEPHREGCAGPARTLRGLFQHRIEGEQPRLRGIDSDQRSRRRERECGFSVSGDHRRHRPFALRGRPRAHRIGFAQRVRQRLRSPRPATSTSRTTASTG